MMQKCLAILAIAAIMTIGVAGQPNKAANPEKQDAKQGQPTVLPADSQNKQASGQADQTKPGSNPPAGNASIERSHWWAQPDWWLIVIAGLTGVVIGWQSWETRKSVHAALLNIETLKTVERSRIHIEAATVDDEVRLEFIFTAVNHGRVPARLTYYFVEALSLEKGAGFPLPYWPGTEEENARLDAIWIPPGHGNGFQLPMEPDVTLYSKENIQKNAPEEWERTKKGDVALFVYGLLRYRDDISPEEHETRFSYMWTAHPVTGLLQGGPPDYTRCT